MTTPLDLQAVETPIGFVDLARVTANARATVAYASAHGLRWRPHIKTHKSREIASIQLAEGAEGLTVATLREAEVMADLTDDILLAYPPVGSAKLARLLRLPAALDLKVGLDSPEVLDGLAAAAAAVGRTVGVLVELDAGLGRVGVQTPQQLVRLATMASELDGVSYRGIMFYPGHIRVSEEDQAVAVAKSAQVVTEALDALMAAGLAPEIVSGGSTPTLRRSHGFPGLTEIRSGSCIFYDREGLSVGVATEEDIAYTVLATVVSTAVPGRAVVDAGSKALAKEGRGEGSGYGVLLDHPSVLVVGLSEEHGVLDISASSWRPSIGDRVRIVPNHVCVSVNLHEQLLVDEGSAYRLLTPEARGRGAWSP
jgi:D-serine deaminase-like pyridoxal phosphate-dependent protein